MAAAFDEIPFMKLFIGQYCSKHTMAASIYKTDGFGYVSLISYIFLIYMCVCVARRVVLC